MTAVAIAQAEPAVSTGDQPVVDGAVTIESVTSRGPGWLAIHADADGKPGPVIGWTAVDDGENSEVVVEIDPAAATPVLHAMLHVDEGVVGTYEFPGPDVPAQVGDAIVMVPFSTDVDMGAETPEDAPADLVDIAATTDDFSTLVAAVQAAGLVETLQGEGPYTVFAPTNEAFEALADGTLEGLLADPAGDLTQILLYHVLPGRVMAADISDGMEVETLQGSPVTFGVTGDGSTTINDANIIASDVEASNGVVHVIDQVLQPDLEAQAAEGALAMAASAQLQQATPAPQEEPAAPAPTPEPAQEQAPAPEPTAAPAEEPAEAAPAPAEEAPAATPAPVEEAAEPAAPAAEGEAKGATPATMPTTGASFNSGATGIAVVLVVLAVLIGGTVLTRRRNLF
jgi:uncharacterized surface protein with fasciclin (FAS1) repeats